MSKAHDPGTEDSSAGDLATESVLIEGVAYTIPKVVALELLRLNIELKQWAKVQAEPVHPDDAAVYALAAKMKAKLAKQRAKGYGGWDTSECSQQRLSAMLRGTRYQGRPGGCGELLRVPGGAWRRDPGRGAGRAGAIHHFDRDHCSCLPPSG
ncbi:hypothetical protein ACCQ08_21810 [Comamonas sp. SY3]|uniref:hypothetical protein n=1 Tax=Comamonas sp. SY3 TaxID=3243601 RepID=UPI0035937AEF